MLLSHHFQLSPEQFCTLILYDWKIGLTYKNCHGRLVQAWEKRRTFLPHSFREFQRNTFSVQHALRSIRPSTSLTEQAIDAVRKIIEDDPHSTYQQIEASLPRQSIHHYLNLRKICAAYTNR